MRIVDFFKEVGKGLKFFPLPHEAKESLLELEQSLVIAEQISETWSLLDLERRFEQLGDELFLTESVAGRNMVHDKTGELLLDKKRVLPFVVWLLNHTEGFE